MPKYNKNNVGGYILILLILGVIATLSTSIATERNRPQVKDYITKINVIDNEKINKENIGEYFEFKKEFVFQRKDFKESNSEEYFHIVAHALQIKVEFKNPKQFKEFKKSNIENVLITASFDDVTILREEFKDKPYVNKIIFNYNIENWENFEDNKELDDEK